MAKLRNIGSENNAQNDVLSLRSRLKQLNAWPEAGDTYLEMIPLSRWHSLPLTEDDYHWLPAVINDTIQGTDIGSKYPSFFQKLLTNASLRETFLDRLTQTLTAFAD